MPFQQKLWALECFVWNDYPRILNELKFNPHFAGNLVAQAWADARAAGINLLLS